MAHDAVAELHDDGVGLRARSARPGCPLAAGTMQVSVCVVEGRPASLKDMAGDRAVVLHIEQVALGSHPGQLGGGQPVAAAPQHADDLAGGGGLARVHAGARHQDYWRATRQVGPPGHGVAGDIGRLAIHSGGP